MLSASGPADCGLGSSTLELDDYAGRAELQRIQGLAVPAAGEEGAIRYPLDHCAAAYTHEMPSGHCQPQPQIGVLGEGQPFVEAPDRGHRPPADGYGRRMADEVTNQQSWERILKSCGLQPLVGSAGRPQAERAECQDGAGVFFE